MGKKLTYISNSETFKTKNFNRYTLVFEEGGGRKGIESNTVEKLCVEEQMTDGKTTWT